MECSATLPQPAQPQPGISTTLSWTDADFHAGANLQGFGNFGDGAGPLYSSSSGPVSSRRLANAEVATTQSRRLPKEDADQINIESDQTDSRTNKRKRLPNKRYQKLQPVALTVRSQSEHLSLTTSMTAVAETWTNAPEATSTTPTMSCISTTPLFSNLATLIYSTFILDHLKSNSYLELNLHKKFFCKFFYPQLISFLDNGLSAQPHLYKSLDSFISSALCFFGF